jgi:hypothetical protein
MIMNAGKEPLPPGTIELLQRILDAVEPAKPKHGFETRPWLAAPQIIFANRSKRRCCSTP